MFLRMSLVLVEGRWHCKNYYKTLGKHRDIDAYRPPGRLGDRHDAHDRHVVVAARVGWKRPDGA